MITWEIEVGNIDGFMKNKHGMPRLIYWVTCAVSRQIECFVWSETNLNNRIAIAIFKEKPGTRKR